MDRFELAPPHFATFGQYGQKICLWRILCEKFRILLRQIGYSFTAPSSITAVAVSSRTLLFLPVWEVDE